jgi:Beta-propeller repeat
MPICNAKGYRISNFILLLNFILIILVIGTVQPAAAQNVRTQWVSRVNGLIQEPYDNTNPKGMAGDVNGNVYVTGSMSLSTSNTSSLTIKYDPFGKVLWKAWLTGSGGFAGGKAISVDSSGNVYVLGSINLKGSPSPVELFTAKYNSSGARLWISYDGNLAFPSAIKTDKSGNVYITGYSTTNGGVWSTLKYSPAGQQLWVSSVKLNTANIPTALVVDGQGNVYVAGQDGDNSPFFSQAVTVKYGPNGNQLWLATYRESPGSNPGSSASLAGIGLDSSGNVYVGGQSTITPYTGPSTSKALLIKYTAAGSRVWLTEYGSANGVNGFALDGTGNAYLTGIQYKSGTNQADYLTLKFNASGTFLWQKLYNGTGIGHDTAYAIALDSSGSAYVTGASTNPNNSTATNITTVKYDTNGNQKWVARYQGTVNGDDTGIGIAYLSLGKLAATGYGAAGSTGDGWVTIGYTQF